MRFAPPNEGLLSNENVVWTRTEIGFWISSFGIFLVVGGVLLISFSFAFAGVIAGVGAIVPVLVGLFLLAKATIKALRTKFFLTNQRIVQTEGTNIVKEMPLERFGDKPLEQYIEIKVGYLENNEPRYVETIKRSSYG